MSIETPELFPGATKIKIFSKNKVDNISGSITSGTYYVTIEYLLKTTPSLMKSRIIPKNMHVGFVISRLGNLSGTGQFFGGRLPGECPIK